MKIASVYCSIFFCLAFHGIDSKIDSENGTNYCPLWMTYNNTLQKCIILSGLSSGSDENSVKLSNDVCLSFDNTRQSLLSAVCPYGYYQQNYSRNLNSSVTPDELNEIMCGPLNREGLFCSKCKPGYGIPVFSKAEDKCVKCDSKFAWALYLAVVLIPITLFYALVLIFNFSATHPPITAYIFYCQLFSQLVSKYNIRHVRHLLETSTNHVLLYLTWTVCDIWNLDMFRYVIPSFCLSERLTNKDALFLELIAAFYPLLLIFVTFILIEMHANNSRLVVFLWRPFHKCFSSFRRTWDPRSSVINAFATFLILSSFKVCFLSFTIFYSVTIRGQGIHDRVLYVEPTVNSSNVYKQAYFVPCLLLLMLFVVIPSFLLCLYPTKVCRIATQRICSHRLRNGLFLFMDAFQGHYRNGTDGKRDCRSASGIGFVLRFLVCILFGRKWAKYTSHLIATMSILLVGASLFYAHVRPYTKHYVNVIESLLHALAALLLIFFNFTHDKYHFLNQISMTIILVPSIIFLVIILYKILDVLGIVRIVKKTVSKKIFRSRVGNGEEAEPHRLACPTQYTPLIQENQ